MLNQIKAFFETLEGLSTEALDQSAEKAVRAEKRNVANVIAHIAEISRRKAELECGYKNIFDYCTRRLKLSEGSVARRLQVANVSRRFPQLLVALADNRISLTVAGLLAPHLREDNVDNLLSDCAGMSTRGVEEYLVALRPKPVFKPSIRKKPSHSKESDKVQSEEQQETLQETEQPEQTPPPAEDTPSQPPPGPSPNVLEAARPDVFNFRFSADGKFKEKFERLAEVLGVENPLKNMAEVFERAVDISLEKKDPKKKQERRKERERKHSVPKEKSRAREISAEEKVSHNESGSRYIPSAVRERLLERAAYQCQYTARDGTRCTARTGLEIEHERPFAIYGSHEERFLKVLCHRHNLFQAERVYGADFIQAKINEKKSQNAFRRSSNPSTLFNSS
jgi:5-methylcytosine-specific restriction endonuclease McrA